MRKLIFVLLVLATVSFASWTRTIARDSEPGIIYFYGPNFEPSDSTENWFLYFSSDTGKTFSIIREYDSHLSINDDNISTDVRQGVFLLQDYGNTYISYDYGITYRDTITGISLIAGGIEGECGSGYFWSSDFGETILRGDISGFPTRHLGCSICPGYQSGMFFAVVDLYDSMDAVFITIDTNNTYMPLVPFRFSVSNIRLGAEYREMFIYCYDSLFYSFDGCTTFAEISEIDSTEITHYHDFIRGWQSREIISWSLTTHFDPIYGYIGGAVALHFSNDCGATWREIVKHDMLAIEETPEIMIQDELELVLTTSEIVSNKNINLFDITGKRLGNGKVISISNVTSGIYIASDGETNKRICIIK